MLQSMKTNSLNICVLVIAALYSITAGAGLYKGLDEEGNIIYSDKPFNNSERFTPPAITVVDAPKIPPKKEAVIEDQVGEIFDTDFVIKKTKNSGGQPAYDKSYFVKNEEPLDDAIIDAFDSGELQLYDLSEVIPKATTTEEMDEWLDKAIEKDNKVARRTTKTSNDSSDKDDDKDDDSSDDDKPKKTSAGSLIDRLKAKNKNKE